MKNFKKIILLLWLVVIAAVWIFYFMNPSFFTQASLLQFLQNFGNYIVIAYIIFSCLRSVFLLPSSILIVVGAFILDPISLFFVGWFGIIVSSALLYYFGDFFDIDSAIKSPKMSKKVAEIEAKINKNGFPIILLWAFIPIFPTDIICYVAGTTQMDVKKFLLGIALGELPVVLFYVLVANGIINYF